MFKASIDTKEDIMNYLKLELLEQRYKWLTHDGNHYSYMFMICNDLGITIEDSIIHEDLNIINGGKKVNYGKNKFEQCKEVDRQC